MITTHQPYINSKEFDPVMTMKNCPERFHFLKAMADAGNVQAAFLYGDMLMAGGWDIKRMETDFVRGQLLPQPLDPNQDPYLILPRQQYLAIEYLKIAAFYPDEKCIDVSKARAHLSFCQTRMDIGYYHTGVLDQFLFTNFYNPMRNKATPQDLMANPFFPLPYARPTIENPKTRVFERMGKDICVACGYQIVGYHILALACNLVSINWDRFDLNENIIATQLYTLVLYTVPLLVTFTLAAIYGYWKAQPLCTCKKLKSAYSMAVQDLPSDLKQEEPFKESPFIVRNINHFLAILFALYALAALILFFFSCFSYVNLEKLFFFMPRLSINGIILLSFAVPIATLFVYKRIFLDEEIVDRYCCYQCIEECISNMDACVQLIEKVAKVL